MLSYRDLEQILNIGVQLSVERDKDQMMKLLFTEAMNLTHCDAAILYYYEDRELKYQYMNTRSMGKSRGLDGEFIDDMPRVEIVERNPVGYAAVHREIVNVQDVYHSDRFDFSLQKRYDARSGYHTQSMLIVPMENNSKELIGLIQLMNVMDEDGEILPFSQEHEMVIYTLSSLTSIAWTNVRYVRDLSLQINSFVEAMATAIDERTPYNGTHTRKVAEYSQILADKINEHYKKGEIDQYFDRDRKEKLELAASLHDIGKMVVPRSVMNRATRLDKDLSVLESRYALLRAYYRIDELEGRYTPDEAKEMVDLLNQGLAVIYRIEDVEILEDKDYDYIQEFSKNVYKSKTGEIIPFLTESERRSLSVRKGTLTQEMRHLMESHVVMTEKILDKVYFSRSYEDVPKWAAQHHEFLDGSGYPRGLTARNLDIESRILTVSDIYDALTSRDRPYKKPMSKEKALEVLWEMTEEGKLDRRLVQMITEAVEEELI